MFKVLKARMARRKALNKLFEEGSYFEFYELRPNYTPSNRVITDDILAETGDKKLVKKIIGKRKYKTGISQTIRCLLIFDLIMAGIRIVDDATFKYLLTDKYESYNEFADEAINYVKNSGFDVNETIGYLYEDTIGYIQGYKEPEYDFMSDLRYNFGENGYGVCRNFADDLSYKLNQIDDKYIATNVVVNEDFMDDYTVVYSCPVDLNLYEETTTSSNDDKKELTEFEKYIKKYKDKISRYVLPNHMLTFAKDPNRDVVLVLDPTNAGVGVLINGKVRMFNGSADVIYSVPYTLIFDDPKMDYDLLRLVNLSFKCPYSYEELESMYGLEEQLKVKNNL